MSKLILSLDGGGIRGAACTQFLTLIDDQLTQRHGHSLRHYVDFYAGTSTGSIITLALATSRLSMSEINKLYSVNNAKQIFAPNKGWFQVDGINAPKYAQQGKTKLLQDKLLSLKIGDVPKGKHVLAVTYDIENRKPVIIKSTQPDHLNIKSFQVADASSAAPTYFPTRPIEIKGRTKWLVDGGVTANNPSMCALSEVRKEWNTPMDDIRLLSIGTGYATRKINGSDSQNWGAIEWFTKGQILDVLTDERVVSYQTQAMLQDGHYIRINSELRSQPGLPFSPDDSLDDISKENIKRLRDLGRFWFEKYSEETIDLIVNTYTGQSFDSSTV